MNKTMNKEDDFMCDYDNAIFRLATETEPEPEDYTGEDGLLYCGSCRQPKGYEYLCEMALRKGGGAHAT